MALAKAAAHAHRIRLGTSVISLPFHHPFHVAERMAFLDHLTRGRAILGVGPCNLITDKKLFGLPNEKLYPMLAESVDIIVRLLESPDPIDYEGRFWSFKEMRLQLRSYQQPRMPLAIASSGNPVSVELAGKYGMLLCLPPVKTGGAPNNGKTSRLRRPNMASKLPATTGASPPASTSLESRRKPGPTLKRASGATWNIFAIGLKAPYESYPGQPAHEITPRSGADRRDWIIGTPDDAIAQIERMQAETGGFGGLMLTTHEWTGTEKLRKSLELFARYVMPHFRGHTLVIVTSGNGSSKPPRMAGSSSTERVSPATLCDMKTYPNRRESPLPEGGKLCRFILLVKDIFQFSSRAGSSLKASLRILSTS